ncbi:hypothetical protein EYC80_000300 [Monilinia laxa]|uniref:Uncharacterized protein n=1 Tax=Monilinia laxa TaxID=61186 RepID=A0A5N6KA53_MONLA|nr:hypothetical protein EYC80_000300 [Monilinia laxa]
MNRINTYFLFSSLLFCSVLFISFHGSSTSDISQVHLISLLSVALLTSFYDWCRVQLFTAINAINAINLLNSTNHPSSKYHSPHPPPLQTQSSINTVPKTRSKANSNNMAEFIVNLLEMGVTNFYRNATGAFQEMKTMELQKWIRIIAVVGAYLLIRPYFIKLGAKKQEAEYAKARAEHAQKKEKEKHIGANSFRDSLIRVT